MWQIILPEIRELPFILYDKRVRPDHHVLDYDVSNLSAIQSDCIITTEDGKLTIDGHIICKTRICLALGTMEEFDQMMTEKNNLRGMNIPVYISRYSPGLKNGKNVHFEVGETVSYRMRNGEEHQIVIDSDRMAHTGINLLGYEAIFDDGVRAFAVEDGIYDWEGKK